ncbi:AAA family ATPase [Pseudanabaena sp. 'Roaring Creek']|uniref:AAA family ATPase n=1 Tax=Pseudanabaena sp. 'Roaring Creek' TaxID=1681830 RepID=UPI0006D7850A|nr:AAA family ATPase [Pseudanabaena sp. 'Roaring Creek']
MHIQQVKIKNFRCFENLTVNLNPDVNIFVGNNGSGKSAVLDAIAAAMFPYINGLQRVAEKRYQGYSNKKYQEPVQIAQRDLPAKYSNRERINQTEFTVIAGDFPSWTIIYRKTAKNNDNRKLSVKTNTSFFSDPQNNVEGSEQLYSDIASKFNKSQEEKLEISVFSYYKNNRNSTNISNVNPDLFGMYGSYNSSDRFDAFKNSFDAASSLPEFMTWFYAREIQELRELKKRENAKFVFSDLEQIRKVIKTVIAPNANVYFSETTSAKLMVEWETEIGEKIELSLNQLSSGFRNMLALVMDFARRLAQANPQMENPLEAEAVLMIDELDLHLHPTWQQKIIPDLRKVFPNTQIIATTHSPEIVTTVERHQVKILEDYQIKECPSPTRGMKSSDVVRYVLGLDNLRPDTEESRTLTALFEAIDNGNLEEAKRLRDKLQDWKSFDPDITRADMQIRRLEREMTA